MIVRWILGGREQNVTAAIWAGAVLMTVDVFSVLFWTLAMLAGWRAVQTNANTVSWLWVGPGHQHQVCITPGQGA